MLLGAISPDAIGWILNIYLTPFRVQRAAVVSELSAKAGVSTTYAWFNYVLDRIAYLEVLFTLHNYNSDQEQTLQMFLIRQSYFAGRKFAGTAAPPLQHFRATSEMLITPAPPIGFFSLTQIWFSLSARDLSESCAPTKSVPGRSSLIPARSESV